MVITIMEFLKNISNYVGELRDFEIKVGYAWIDKGGGGENRNKLIVGY